ncbi:MAG TPA: glutamate formiminotransferase, partial [Actinomycetota bacterium]|nr:glutamate formiminotransferase [Actinomycetota bacterium]
SIGRSAGRPGVHVLDVHTDPDHNRSVLTLAGRAGALVDGVVAAASMAVQTIHLPTHEGVHPRFGAIDVIPFVPVGTDPGGMATAVSAAREAARRIADEVGIPCFLYEEAGCGRSLPEVRRRAFADLAPDFGGPGPHPVAGAVAVGAREPLVAYNVDLDTADLELARRIAASVRERDGGLPHVRALGLPLPSRGIVQVSTNLLRPTVTTIGDVFEAVAGLAAAAGVGVEGSEIVGLTPRAALPASTTHLLLREPPRILETELALFMASHGGEAGTTNLTK